MSDICTHLDQVLVTDMPPSVDDCVPSQLGVASNAQMLDTIALEIAPAFRWRRKSIVTDSASAIGL